MSEPIGAATMSPDSEQTQRSGANSTNVQILNVGPTWSETRELVLDVVRSEIYRYSQESQQLADARAAAIAEKIVNRVAQDGPELAAAFRDPDIQHVVSDVGSAYVRYGDDNLADVLVDLLADRCHAEGRSLMALILNDAISTAAKLTDAELGALSVAWRLHRSRDLHVVSFETLRRFLTNDLLPFARVIPEGEASYYHLQYLGCLAVQPLTESSFEALLRGAYAGLFCAGFTEQEVPAPLKEYVGNPQVFIQCLNAPDKMQVNAMHDGVIEAQNLLPEPNAQALKNLLNNNLLADHDIKAKALELVPELDEMIAKWNSSDIRRVVLTSVGIAIAHANYRRVTGLQVPLSNWIS